MPQPCARKVIVDDAAFRTAGKTQSIAFFLEIGQDDVESRPCGEIALYKLCHPVKTLTDKLPCIHSFRQKAGGLSDNILAAVPHQRQMHLPGRFKPILMEGNIVVGMIVNGLGVKHQSVHIKYHSGFLHSRLLSLF